MKYFWILLIFCVGILFGWTLKSTSQGAPQESTTPTLASKAPRDRKTEPTKEAHALKWQSLAKRVATSSDDEERKSLFKDLAPDDRAKALEALMGQCGPSNSYGSITSAMSEILQSWAAADLDGVLAYCEKCSNLGIRKFMIGKVLEAIVEKDPDRAISLYAQEYAKDPSFRSDALFRLAYSRMGESAEQLVDMITKLPKTNGISLTSAEFAKNYNFQLAADGIAAVITANPGKTPAVLPYNFIESWAGKDPEAAYAWWLKNGPTDEKPNTDWNNWTRILEGVEKYNSSEAAAAWIVGKLEQPDVPREKMIRDLSIGSGGRPARFNAIARAMPDVESQDRFLTDAISAISSLTSLDGYAFAVSGLSSPQARLNAFQKIAAKNEAPSIEKFDDAQLNAWGITRQELQQAFTPK